MGFDLVERAADAVFWFSPAAFCYYLPGFMLAGIRENRTDSNAYDALIGMLDRSPEPDYWDEFFLPRWTALSVAEIEAVSAWVEWLADREPDLLDRAYQVPRAGYADPAALERGGGCTARARRRLIEVDFGQGAFP